MLETICLKEKNIFFPDNDLCSEHPGKLHLVLNFQLSFYCKSRTATFDENAIKSDYFQFQATVLSWKSGNCLKATIL